MPPTRSRKKQKTHAESHHQHSCKADGENKVTKQKESKQATGGPKRGANKAAKQESGGTSTSRKTGTHHNHHDGHDHNHDGGCEHTPDYSSKSLWDKRYRDGVFVEWYCGFEHLQPLFERYVPKDCSALDVGCGDKPLAWEMRDAGYTGSITSVDFSSAVIEKLLAEKEGSESKRLDDKVDFKVLDARDLPFEDGSFDLVVDKGTVDAVLCDKAGMGKARAICQESARVLSAGGWLVIVSHCHPSKDEGMQLLSEVLVPALKESCSSSSGRRKTGKNRRRKEEEQEPGEFFWSIDVHCQDDEDEEGDGDGDDDGDGDSDGDGDGDGDGEEGHEGEAGHASRNGEHGQGGHDHDHNHGHGHGHGHEEDHKNDHGHGHDEDHKHDHGHGQDQNQGGASDLAGPSVYMMRKLARRRTRVSGRKGPHGQQQQQQQRRQRDIPIRIHEY